MFLADHFINQLWDIEPSLIFFVVANAIECIALVTAIILLIRYHRIQLKQVQVLQTLVLRGIQPEELVKLKSTLDRLSEADLEELLAARGRPPETGSSTGSPPRNR
jgi:ribosomal protein L12E/L44/L45/RPP1/RPP2